MKGRTLLASQDAFNFVALEVSVHAWQGVNRCLLLISNHSWCIDINLFAIPLFLEYSRAVDVLKLLVSCIEFALSNHSVDASTSILCDSSYSRVLSRV